MSYVTFANRANFVSWLSAVDTELGYPNSRAVAANDNITGTITYTEAIEKSDGAVAAFVDDDLPVHFLTDPRVVLTMQRRSQLIAAGFDLDNDDRIRLRVDRSIRVREIT